MMQPNKPKSKKSWRQKTYARRMRDWRSEMESIDGDIGPTRAERWTRRA